MKIDKILLVSIIMLAILTVGAVSAAQDVDMAAGDDAGNIAVSSADDDSIVDSNDDSDDLADDDDFEEDDFGDDDYGDDGELEDKFNVTMNVEKPDKIYVNDEARFSVSVSPVEESEDYDLFGEVNLYLNGEEIDWGYVSYGNPITFYYDEIDEFGLYNFRVEYVGNDYFNGAFEEFTYNLTNDMYLIYIPDTAYYGEENFKVSASVENPTDIVITINGKKFNVTYDDWYGEYVCDASALQFGLNTVNVYYPGDEEFAEYSKDENITVLGVVECENTDIVLGESLNFTLVLPADATGKLTLYEVTRYEDESEEEFCSYREITNVDLKNGFANILISDLGVGYYEMMANFTGTYAVAQTEWDIRVRPIMTVPRAVFAGDEKAFITVEAGADGAGSVTARVYEYDEFDDYEDVEPVATLNANIENGQAKLSLAGLEIGKYRVLVSYYKGDESYSASQHYTLYVVEDMDFDINITYYPKNVVVNSGSELVEFDLPEFADGGIYLFIDGIAADHTQATDDPYLYFDTINLTVGEHTLSVNFTSKYQKNSSASAKFNVASAKIYIPDKIDIDYEHASSNDVYVYVNDEASGTITISIDGKKYQVKDIESKKTSYYFPLTNVSRGSHNVSVRVDDKKYGSVNETKLVNFGYAMYIDADTVYGDDNNITVSVPRDLDSAKLTITVDGVKQVGWTMNDGVIVIGSSKLSIGNHTVVVNYAGDDFYPPYEVNQTFEVYAQIRSNASYSMLAGLDKGIYLIMPGDAKGKLNVTVWVEKEYDYGDYCDYYWEKYDSKLVSFIDGKAYYSFAGLPFGNYEYLASYTGDDYDVEDINEYFTVSCMDWGDEELNLGENKTIYFVSKFSEPGQLHIIFSRIVDRDKSWEDPVNLIDDFTIPLVNGRANYTFTDLILGDYYISATEENLEGEPGGYWGEQDFSVVFYDFDYPYGDYVLGNITSFSFNFPEGTEGILTMNVSLYDDDKPYKNVNYTVNGPTTIDINDVITDAGEYRINIHYTGNKGNWTCDYIIYLNVEPGKKLDPNIEVSAPDKVTIADNFTVSITSPKDSSAKITVTVDGIPIEAIVIDGKSSVVVPALIAGNMTIVVYFEGDSKYENQTKELTVNVAKMQTTMTVTCDEKIKKGSTLVINVKVADALIGEVTVNIAGGNFSAAFINGTATVEVPNLAIGTYKATITYPGDLIYEAVTQTKTVSVVVDPSITAKNTAVVYSAKGKFTATVKGTDGKPASGIYVTFKIKGKQVAKVKTNANGVATYVVTKTPGKYSISATALGKTVTKTLTVKHVVSLYKVTVKKSAKKLVLTAKLAKVNGKYLKNKKVTFRFNGKIVTVKIKGKVYKYAKTNKKGVARVTVPSSMLKNIKTKKVTYKATYLKDTVKRTVNVKN